MKQLKIQTSSTIRWCRHGIRAFKNEKQWLYDCRFQPLTIITKCSILDVAVVALDPPLRIVKKISLEYIDK